MYFILKPTLLISSLLIFWFGASSRGVDAAGLEFYDKFRAIFGSVSTLQPYDIDQITSQILKQVNCTHYLGVDCYNVTFFSVIMSYSGIFRI